MIDDHKGTQENRAFEREDQVLLSTKNLNLKHGRARKLTPKCIGPFETIKVIAEERSYKLKLPKSMEKIHHTFYISLLKPFYGEKKEAQSGNKSAPEQVVKPERQVIDQVLKHRFHKIKLEYLVRYKGNEDTENRSVDSQIIITVAPPALIYRYSSQC
ncbi:hypothetical protein BWQ96_03760 [Gracilariopsis chorda]|uniref:Tf2-1-like SH3-like domain-containing protein n=1 Tax=Gracilariopsis chorda TaxID=448386 RepID=A0A2V3IWT1_9FLOR|nr:hypothetical protein BWQ96_03760 [Gracilariopsis chorda]|eukprot:PXF46525.1 hypothetical protein BWQ96_03760 [Gracilariopsis chorda]